MAHNRPLFTAVSSSARQISSLLRCISFAKQVQVRIAADGIRFSAEDGSVMEAFVFLKDDLFTSYKYHIPYQTSPQDRPPEPLIFEINFVSLLETLNIFSISDPSTSKRPGEYDSFAAHRLSRHAFSNQALDVTGICTFSYDAEGSPLSIHMSEAGVTTTCDLTTYETGSTEEIPFNRENLALKAIMQSNYLLDGIGELNTMSPTDLTIQASPNGRLSLSATGALGSATVDFTTDTDSETPILETLQCPSRIASSFKFSLIKAAQRAMSCASKVSLRLDDEGVLSMQYLVEVEAASGASDGVVFVDFRVVPLVESEGEDDETESDASK